MQSRIEFAPPEVFFNFWDKLTPEQQKAGTSLETWPFFIPRRVCYTAENTTSFIRTFARLVGRWPDQEEDLQATLAGVLSERRIDPGLPIEIGIKSGREIPEQSELERLLIESELRLLRVVMEMSAERIA